MVQVTTGLPQRDIGGALGSALGQGLQQGFQRGMGSQFEQALHMQRQQQASDLQSQRQQQLARQQQQQASQEQSRLQQALAEYEQQNPNMDPLMKQQLGLYKALSGHPEIAKQLAGGQQKLAQQQEERKFLEQYLNPQGQQTQLSEQVPQAGIGNVGKQPPQITQRNTPLSDQEILAISIRNPVLGKQLQAQKEAQERRQNEEIKAQRKEIAESKKETAPLRKEIAERAATARQSLLNKQRQMELIDSGKIDDPTVAIFLDSLPGGYGRRLLSPETVEYKAGLVDEFRDLRNIFQGQTRVKEIDLLEKKIADLYLTDEQKKRVLKSRMKAQESDILREEAASDLEKEHPEYGTLQFSTSLEKAMKNKQKHVVDQVLDDVNNVIKEAETRKKRTLDVNNPEDAEIGRQILQEAGNDIKKAYKLAEQKGYKFPKR